MQGIGANTANNNLDGTSSDNSAAKVFRSPEAGDNGPTTAGNYRLKTNSPAIDKGDNTLVTTTTDADGNPRTVNGTVDLGAYEYDMAVLPVTLDGFTAWLKGDQLFVDWSTLTETNNSHFFIEASTDGATFHSIGRVGSLAPGGNSDQSISYSFEINWPSTGAFLRSGLLFLLFSGMGKRKKWLSLAAIVLFSIGLVSSCNKKGIVTSNPEGKVYLRIVQVDKDGVRSYSKTVVAGRR